MGPGNNGKEYVAWEFNSGTTAPDQTGQISLEIPQFGGADSARKIWTFSKCPGDFNREIIEQEYGPACWQPDTFGSLTNVLWSGSNAGSSFRCDLASNETYYLNVLYTDSDPDTVTPSEMKPHPTCVSGRCGNNLVPNF